MNTTPFYLLLAGSLVWAGPALGQEEDPAPDVAPAPPDIMLEAPPPAEPLEAAPVILIEAESGPEMQAVPLPTEAEEPAAAGPAPAPSQPPPAGLGASRPRPPARPSLDRPARNGAAAAPTTTSTASAATAPNGNDSERNLRLNFRGAPLELVLDYLSEAAGFVIVLETEVRGKLDVWSNQPLTKDEAVDLLNRVLAKNGYAAVRDGRTLTIMTRDEAKKRDIPVRAGNNPADIPKSEAIVTQIIPVRFINAVQLARDLQPLFPPSATIAANEGGNAVVVTDTQANIRRIAEIIRALDTSIASVSTVRVFPLRYADAKALATVVRELFTSADAGRGGSQQQQQIFRGFRGGPPGFGGDQGGQSSSSGSGRVATPRVVAVADERSNSLVVSAPEDQMLLIADLVEQVDVSVDDVTELRVFRLRYADAQETADLINQLFQDTTSQNNQARGPIRFGGGPGGFVAQLQNAGAQQPSTRLQKQNRVLAVPDLRTQSVVVSAAREIMDQLAVMIAQLDSDPARKQKVFTFSVENTDPAQVEEILRGLFETQNTRNRAASTRNTSRQAGSQLNNRAATTLQNQGRTGARTGLGGGTTTGFGTGGVGR
jgi:type II secretory pathway component GspD/PulD (secretin)